MTPREQLERDWQFLAKIQPTQQVNRCWQEGCHAYIQAYGTFQTPLGPKEYRLCMQHFQEARQFAQELWGEA
jgi:hypothetical protein